MSRYIYIFHNLWSEVNLVLHMHFLSLLLRYLHFYLYAFQWLWQAAGNEGAWLGDA